MNIFKSRRSIRKFTAEPIPQEVMTSILEDAMSGPSAMRRDPWEFIVVDDRKILADLAALHPYGGMLNEAAIGVVVCGDMEKANSNSESYMLQDVSAAVENLLLSAESHNIGSCWLGVHPRTERIEGISKYFSLPGNIIPVAVVALGFKAETKAPETRYDKNKIHYNGF